MKENFMDIIMWLIVAALVVLVIMNAQNFATAISSIGTQANGTLGILSGSGYKAAS